MWARIYALAVVVIFPSLICLIVHMIIFDYARSSTRRVQPTLSTVTTATPFQHPPRVTRRDIHLLKSMFIMFSIFVGGWSPIYVFGILQPDATFSTTLPAIFTFLAQISCFLILTNLFLYNHELIKYYRYRLCAHVPPAR